MQVSFRWKNIVWTVEVQESAPDQFETLAIQGLNHADAPVEKTILKEAIESDPETFGRRVITLALKKKQYAAQ